MATLKPRKASENQPKRLIFLDSETNRQPLHVMPGTFSHTLRLAVSSKWVWVGDRPSLKTDRAEIDRLGPYSCRERKLFRSPGEFIDWLASSCPAKFTTYLFAHSVAFDARTCGIFDAISSGRLRWDVKVKPTPSLDQLSEWSEAMNGCIVLSDPPTILSLRVPGGGRLVILDTMNYWPKSLKEIGEMVGLAKLDMPSFDDSDRQWVSYCERDVKIIERAVISLVSWLDQNGLGELRYTTAGQSSSIFKSRYLKREIVSSDNTAVRKLERDGYYGGEVVIYRLGEIKESINQLDVRSLYPFVMHRMPVPVEIARRMPLKDWRKGLPPTDLLRTLARVRFVSGNETAPKRDNDSMAYCRGSFDTVLCGPELSYHASRGRILAHREWIEYDCEPILSDFVTDIWGARREAILDGNELSANFYKMMMNGLYGKFGQLSGDLVPRTDFMAPIEWGRWVSYDTASGKARQFMVIGGFAFEEVGRKEIAGTMPAISAWITSGARVYMAYLRQIVGRANLIYQAVDSLIVTQRGLARLKAANMVDPSQLGKLKLEQSAPMGIVSGWGDYSIGNVRKLVGVKGGAVQHPDGSHTYSAFTRLREAMFGPPGCSVIERKRHVMLPQTQPVGTVDKLGNVRPVAVWEPLPTLIDIGGERVGSANDVASHQVKDPCQVLFGLADSQLDGLNNGTTSDSQGKTVSIGAILQQFGSQRRGNI